MSGTIDPGTEDAEADTITAAVYAFFIDHFGEPEAEETQLVWKQIAASIAQGFISNIIDSLSDGDVLQVLDGELVGGLGGVGGVRVVFQRVTSMSLSDPSTTETDMVGTQGSGVEIPADTIVRGGSLRFRATGVIVIQQNDEGTITFRVRLGASTLATIVVNATDLNIETYRFELTGEFACLVSDSLQFGQGRIEISSEGIQPNAPIALGGLIELAGTADTTGDRDFRLTAQLSASIDGQVLCTYAKVEVVHA